jgi:hypothetical protein
MRRVCVWYSSHATASVLEACGMSTRGDVLRQAAVCSRLGARLSQFSILKAFTKLCCVVLHQHMVKSVPADMPRVQTHCSMHHHAHAGGSSSSNSSVPAAAAASAHQAVQLHFKQHGKT